eukprot:TRINITY_DN2797_c0_g1_i2.p1 TRINITY_DN2797_c0_g1~~TRINITY_DN2797_c0_g1_i2.p1  ORF type:complete len:475 (+),score=91.09 TRINITY_DN2797_c0_g1_i2:118-1542(+)
MLGLCLFLLSVTVQSSYAAHPIKNVVVLMMENRSFDHMLGFLHKNGYPEVNGLTGEETNPEKSDKPNGKHIRVSETAPNVSPDDPRHDFSSTFEEIYGHKFKKAHDKPKNPKMDGFVQNALEAKHHPQTPMRMFNHTTAPVIHSLALEFALFDEWFCALPGPTDPNRFFAMSGTSHGWNHNFNHTLLPQETYFGFLEKHNVTWKGFYQHDPWALMYFKQMHEKRFKERVVGVDEFFKDAKAGTLPQFSWIQPKLTAVDGPPTWQHPDAPVSEGEKYIKSIYEALRKSPQWNETAMILTYDEHGGFYDHVSPPQEDIPSPDGIHADDGFTFNRLGIRVPTVVISPWVPKKTLVHKPTSGGPYFDATAVIATCNKIFGLKGEMTKRTSWVGTFEDLFTKLDEPRTDCPMTLDVKFPPFTDKDLRIQHAKPINDHMEIQVQFYCKFNNHGPGCGSDLTNQYEASVFLVEEAKKFMAK